MVTGRQGDTLKVLGAYRSDAGGYFRIAAPFSVLQYRYPDAVFEVHPPTMEAALEYDVLWLYQHADPVAELVAREFKLRGKPVVYDVDDWLFGLPASWPGYDHYFNRGSGTATQRLIYHERLLRLADVVTTPTQALADMLQEHADLEDVRVLPNCVLQGDWDSLIPKEHDLDGPVVGWFGTGTHWDDWAEIVDEVAQAIEEIDGYLAIVGAPEVIEMFPARLAERTQFQELVPIRRMQQSRELIKAFDVGLAWSTDRFAACRCRSPLKAMQYGAAGVPVVASKTVYGDLPGWAMWISHEETNPWPLGSVISEYGLLARGPGAVRDAIVAAVENRGAMQSRAAAWQERVWREHSYENKAGLWLDLAEGLVGRAGGETG